jgi:hypothetical protein
MWRGKLAATITVPSPVLPFDFCVLPFDLLFIPFVIDYLSQLGESGGETFLPLIKKPVRRD